MKTVLSRLLAGASSIVLTAGGAHAQTMAQPISASPTAVNAPQPAADASAPAPQVQSRTNAAPPYSDDIIVTAQKRSENINKVGMSITAQTGDQLLQQGITSTADLAKIVPGFTFEGAVGVQPVYSIRGIGFHDTSLASGQTVAIYSDEVPMPFALETVGVDYDLDRVEVLKGPQGTLFGQNSTGGAVNYVTAKPTSTPEAGVTASYGRFATSDITGFLSGPITDSLRARVAFRSIQGSGWQQRYGLVPVGNGPGSDTVGKMNRISARVLVDWTPVDRFTVSLNFNLRRDRSDMQVPQLVRINPSSPANPLDPAIVAFPLAPNDDRAAAFDPGVDYSQDNRWEEGTARLQYDAGGATLTSISAYQHYVRDAPAQDADGEPYKVLQYANLGDVKTFYQELRASGSIAGNGNWIVGANYEHDKTYDQNAVTNPAATSRVLFGLPNPGSRTISTNRVSTYGAYGNADYPVLPNLTLQAGARYTESDRVNTGCTQDRGDGTFSAIFVRIQSALAAAGAKTTPIVPIAPGGCVTLDTTFTPTLFTGTLKEHNFSWRVGANWTATPGTLLYANVSKGYKSGSFPLAPAASTVQYTPVPQEGLLAYEVGLKSRVVQTLQFNASAYYYDYTAKQIGGTYIDAIFGRLPRLVSIPKSRVYGFEVSADWRPVRGLTIAPAVSYTNSRILGNFTNFTPQGVVENFAGEPFPYAPRWQATGSADYKWSISNTWLATIGGNVSYQSKTNGQLGQAPVYNIKAFTLVDLRAGVESKSGAYRFSVWGTNVFNEFYLTRAYRSFDFDVRTTGMPARYGVTFAFRYK